MIRKRKRIFRRKGCLISLAVLIILVAGGVVTLQVLKRSNDAVKEYFLLPKEVRKKNIELEAERLWHLVFKPKISEEDIREVTREQVYNSVVAGANWLLAMQEPSGRFKYWYNPLADIFSDRWDDNFLRQAGTAYSLTWVYQLTGDSQYLEASRRNLHYLFRYLKIHEQDKMYFLFNSKAKLGGIALPVLAMIKIRELTGTVEYDLKLQRLTNMIIFLQDYGEEGKFKSTFVYDGAYDYETQHKWESMIYPGEAMFALEEMYRTFKMEKYKTAFDKAVHYYDKGRYNRKLSYVPWTTSALSNMAIGTGEEKYLEYAIRLCRYTLYWQNPNPDDIEFGSFFGLPNVFSSVYLEGIGDCIHALDHFGKAELAGKYRLRARAGYHWLMYVQISKEEADTLRNPKMAFGGFPTSAHDQLIRIDNTQHSISAMTKGLLYVYVNKESK